MIEQVHDQRSHDQRNGNSKKNGQDGDDPILAAHEVGTLFENDVFLHKLVFIKGDLLPKVGELLFVRLDDVLQLLAAGASRLGLTATAKIAEEARK